MLSWGFLHVKENKFVEFGDVLEFIDLSFVICPKAALSLQLFNIFNNVPLIFRIFRGLQEPYF